MRRWVPAIAPLGVAAVLVAVGHGGRAPLLVALALVAALAIWRGVDVAGGIGRVARAIGRGIELVVSAGLFVLLVLPLWAWSRLRRRDPLRPPTSSAAAGWAPTGRPAPPSRLGSDQPAIAPRPLWRTAVGVVEVVLLVAAANFALGWAWDRATGRSGPNSLAEVTGAGPRARVDDPRVDAPAMADAPWRERYFADLQATTVNYWPFTEYRPEPYESPYLNLDGWTRRGYRTPGDPGGRPTVWMLGGSTTFGEGQRDEHTVASELTRLAEAEGLPIEVANFGQRGWGHWQELILFEQRLHLEDPPDVAVFYDGANEIASQALLNEAVPSNTLVLQLAERLAGAGVATRFVQGGAAADDSLWHAYTQHSLAHKLVYAFQPSAAGAAPAQEDPVNVDGAEPSTDGLGTTYLMTPEDGTDAGRIYERGRRLTEQIARDAGVDTLYLWQPVEREQEAHRRARAELGADVVDLGDALDDHPEVYLDGVHTNEAGARLIAEAAWPHLRPLVEAWYEDQG